MVTLEDTIGKYKIETDLCNNPREYLDICKYEGKLINCSYYYEGSCMYHHNNPKPAIVLKNYVEEYKK